MSLPYPSALLVEALRARPAVAGLCDSEIATRLHGKFPAVRVGLVGGPDRPANATGRPLLQAECWGDGDDDDAEGQAEQLAAAVDDAAQDLAGAYAAGTIVSSWTVGHYLHAPDPDTRRERFIVQIGLLTQ